MIQRDNDDDDDNVVAFYFSLFLWFPWIYCTFSFDSTKQQEKTEHTNDKCIAFQHHFLFLRFVSVLVRAAFMCVRSTVHVCRRLCCSTTRRHRRRVVRLEVIAVCCSGSPWSVLSITDHWHVCVCACICVEWRAQHNHCFNLPVWVLFLLVSYIPHFFPVHSLDLCFQMNRKRRRNPKENVGQVVFFFTKRISKFNGIDERKVKTKNETKRDDDEQNEKKSRTRPTTK